MSVHMLADYMAASEQAKRTILRNCKFPPKAPVIQHQDARESISEHMSSGIGSTESIESRIEILRAGLAGSKFENAVAENNADYLERFLEKLPQLPKRVEEVSIAGKMPPLELDGCSLTCSPQLLLKRVNNRNVPKMGIGFLRYSKGKPLSSDVADWQTAIQFGYLKTKLEQGAGPFDVDPERELSLVVDVWTGKVYDAPGNSVYRFNEVKAVCAGIAERWDQVQPPPNAVI